MSTLSNKILPVLILVIFVTACQKYDQRWNYPGGSVNPYTAIYDVRALYKGSPVKLDQKNLGGSSRIAAIVVSDHSAGNLPEGLLVVQNSPRLNLLRGLSINIGDAAKGFVPGDSVEIDLIGSTLERVNGILQITSITADKIEKKGSGMDVPIARVNIDKILANPDTYESTLLAIVKGGFTYAPQPGQVLSGDQDIADGFGIINVRTEAGSSLASLPQYKMANYYGIVFCEQKGSGIVPYHKLRKASDLVELTSVYKTPKAIITGWHNDPGGTDANNEYIQFIATEDIDFSVTPFSVVTTNNANASAPTGAPANGWATGNVRTYKINITSGFAAKGTLFYVGGANKLIDATSSTSIAQANWVAAYPYNTQDGAGFGTKTTNLLANSGNAYGVAIFEGTTVTKESVPEDVMFVGTGGSLLNLASGYGYRICNNDFYDLINPITLAEQPFYRSGTNTNAMAYYSPTDAGMYNSFGGVFNLALGRWTTARSQTFIPLTNSSVLTEIENPELITKLVE